MLIDTCRHFPNAIPRGWPWLGALALLLMAGGAHAGAVFKCIDAHGAIAFQGAPCAAQARQTAMEIREQPLIDPDGPAGVVPMPSRDRESSAAHRTTRTHARGRDEFRAPAREQTMSWECRASDGEVFYRHTRCPGSIAGDGVVRGDGAYLQNAHGRNSRARNSRAHNAWGSLPVSARKVSRADACKQIDGAGAAGRDGSARDEQVSVYDHNLGRDPCHGY